MTSKVVKMTYICDGIKRKKYAGNSIMPLFIAKINLLNRLNIALYRLVFLFVMFGIYDVVSD